MLKLTDQLNADFEKEEEVKDLAEIEHVEKSSGKVRRVHLASNH